MSRDLYCGVSFHWSWDYRFWAWFTSHGVQSGYRGGYSENVAGGLVKPIKMPDRVFDRIYHLGPLRVKFGILTTGKGG